jgi:predicted dehydrogenase
LETHGSLDELLDKRPVDAVAIAVPPDLQPPIAARALERGMAVFVEKPLAATLDEAEQLVTLARRKQATTAVDFLFPEIGVWRTAERLVREGAIGRPLHILVDWRFESHDHRHGLRSWKTEALRGGGVLQHFGSHVLHYLSRFAGEIERVSGDLSGPEHGDTLATLHLTFAGGTSAAALLCNRAPGRSARHVVSLYGDAGAMHLTGGADNPVQFSLTVETPGGTVHDIAPDEAEPSMPPGTDPRVGPVERLVRRFLAAAAERRPMRPSFDDGLTVQRWMATVCGKLAP